MSKMINAEIISYIKSRKKRSPSLSVRKLSELVGEKFSIEISKSSISWILKKNALSSPRGRRVTRIEGGCVPSDLAGFAIFLAAEKISGVCDAVVSALSVLPAARVFQKETLELSTMAWLLSSMLYGTSFERAQDYEKNEIWGLIGRRVSQPTLKKYLHLLESMQLIKKQIVMEIRNRISWIGSIRIETNSGVGFLMDAEQRSLWGQRATGHTYYLTSYFSSSYIMTCLRDGDPLAILSGGPEASSHEPLKDLIEFGVHCKKEELINIYLIDINGVRVSKLSVDPSGLTWVVGVWPWQIKSLFEKTSAPTGEYRTVDGSKVYPYRDMSVRIPQLIENEQITTRMILVYFEDRVTPRVALLTNVDAEKMSAEELVSRYFSRFGDPESLYRDLLDEIKQPIYFELVKNVEPLNEAIMSIESASSPRDLFRAIGDLVCAISLRVFFPPSAWSWSAMKVKECYLKSKGTIGWNKYDSVVYSVDVLNELSSSEIWHHVAREINALPLQIGPLKKRLQLHVPSP